MSVLRRQSIKGHSAGGHVVTGPLSVSGVLQVASKAVIKALQANSTFAGATIVTSGLAVQVVSLTTIKSDSLIMLQPVTSVASDLIVNFSINPASTVDGISFMVLASNTTARNVAVNYMLIETV